MGVEHGKQQQFFMPDKGGGGSGQRKREEARQLEQALQEFRNGKPTIVFSTEPKVDPSSPLPTLISNKFQEEGKRKQRKSRKKRKNVRG